MAKTIISNKEELREAYIAYKAECAEWGIYVSPVTFVAMIFNSDVRFDVDHDALLQSFSKTEAKNDVH